MARRRSHQKYQFKHNRYVPAAVVDVGAEAVGRAIEQCTDNQSGVVDKKQLVRNAKPSGAPLHPCFEWCDEVAAEEYRQVQARNIVNVITVEVQPGQRVSAFPSVSIAPVSAGSAPHRENIAIQNVMDDPELRHQRISEVLSKIIRLRREYQFLNELEVLWNAVDAVSGSLLQNAS